MCDISVVAHLLLNKSGALDPLCFFYFLAKVLHLRMKGIAPCAAQNVSVLAYRNVHQNFLISVNSDTV